MRGRCPSAISRRGEVCDDRVTGRGFILDRTTAENANVPASTRNAAALFSVAVIRRRAESLILRRVLDYL